MDQRRSRDLPHPVGAAGTTLVSNGRYYVAGADPAVALAGKVNDTGDTITGVVTIRANGDPVFLVEGSAGADIVYVTQSYNEFVLPNGVDLVITNAAPGAGSEKFRVAGETGDMTIAGAIDHNGTTVGFYGKTPVTQPAANADTSGATLAALETEVNEIKALLRSVGLMAP
jgi:hypothetical protein